MLKNYLKIAFRNIIKHKLNSILNIVGLSLAIASSMLIIFHVRKELSYDKHYAKADRIYRVTQESIGDNGSRIWAATSFPLALRIKDDIPEIEQSARFYYTYTRILSYKNENRELKKFEESRGYYADANVINMFDLKFITGNPQNALKQPNSIVLTKSMAKKYFGDQKSVGKIIIDDTNGRNYLITGVIENLPFSTHLQFDYLLSMSTFYSQMANAGRERLLTNIGWNALYTYVLVNKNQSRENIESKLTDFTTKYFAAWGTKEEILSSTVLHLQPITEIHLFSNIEKEMSPNSSIEYVYIFSIIALFFLLIAGMNFINISTAQAFKRMKEVGMRKVLGAQRRQIVGQFLGESILMTIFSAAVAAMLIRLSLPLYNSFSGNNIELSQLFSFDFIFIFMLITVLIGTISGLYPALFISALKLIDTFKSLRTPKSSVTTIRKGLVVFQFIISIFMIFSTIIIYKQLDFLLNKDLGFDKEKLVAIKLYGDLNDDELGNASVLKSKLLANPAIISVTKASKIPGERFGASDFKFDGLLEKTVEQNMRFIFVGDEFFKTLKTKLVEGRSFSNISPNTHAFIINEAAAEILNIQEPLGVSVESGASGNHGSLIGTTKNFNYASLHNKVEPLIIEFLPTATHYLIVRLNSEKIRETLEFIEAKVKQTTPGHLFIYSFIDDNLNRLYSSEKQITNIFSVFSLLAIVISCLGLYGLSSYSAELRIKEIGIRKVLGAASSSIILLLSKDYVAWVIAANIFALPTAWFVMNKWLQNFAYQINIGWWIFLFAGVLVLVIVLFTVSYQAIRAATANPVKSLRYE